MNINLTENSYIYQSAKRLLNRELERCTQKLKENEKAWNTSMDLKLHDAYAENIDFKHNGATVSFSAEAQAEWFDGFCNFEYDNFIDWCKEERIDFDELRNNIGQTSSFYLGKLHNNEPNRYLCAISEIIPEIYQATWIMFKEEHGIIVYDEETTMCAFEDSISQLDMEGLVNEMLSTTETIYNNLSSELDPIIRVHKYIEDFKENQVERFKTFVKDSWINNI